MAQKNEGEGVFIPQKLAQWIADYMSMNSIPKVPWGELNNALVALIECSKPEPEPEPEPGPEPAKEPEHVPAPTN